ncbi:alpha/beta fold hydrolase [Phycicoccus flavus]|uniref:alpha/beta fold hydrolase n=1 Tax=Phycicoccus flavus TaxID=2502783 RepID=UPI000FEBD080|nr:alpha/beta hydrolase [Phycicoccus flavus]NHA66718.1 alpha/beta hydrolase [Phycicoccus flavus]
MDTTTTTSPLVLVPGHWLGAWAWDAVRADLEDRGLTVHAVTLPGLDPGDTARASRDLEDQAAALLAVCEQAAGTAGSPVTLVAHSGANHPATLVLDRRPDLVARVVWVDSGPVAAGAVLLPDLPADVVELPLPPFPDLGRQASLDGLDEAALATFRERAVPEPGPVLRAATPLTNPARRAVPATLVCCSLGAEQVRAMAAAGHPMMAEVATLEDVDLVDLPTGHWPMWSRPGELAAVLAACATGEEG